MRFHPQRSSTALRYRNRGASSVEYILILALVVIPIALLSPMILHMITVYSSRIGMIIRLPFG